MQRKRSTEPESEQPELEWEALRAENARLARRLAEFEAQQDRSTGGVIATSRVTRAGLIKAAALGAVGAAAIGSGEVLSGTSSAFAATAKITATTQGIFADPDDPIKFAVRKIYHDVLGREIDSAQTQVGWVNYWKQHGGDATLASIMDSPEAAKNHLSQIQFEIRKIYRQFLHREVDAAGMNTWVQYWSAHGPDATLAAILESAEGKAAIAAERRLLGLT